MKYTILINDKIININASDGIIVLEKIYQYCFDNDIEWPIYQVLDIENVCYNDLCDMCKDYDDTWTYNDFCNNCQEKLNKYNGRIE